VVAATCGRGAGGGVPRRRAPGDARAVRGATRVRAARGGLALADRGGDPGRARGVAARGCDQDGEDAAPEREGRTLECRVFAVGWIETGKGREAARPMPRVRRRSCSSWSNSAVLAGGWRLGPRDDGSRAPGEAAAR